MALHADPSLTPPQELAEELSRASGRLEQIGIFRAVRCEVDAGQKDDDVVILVDVEEKGRHTVSTGTFVNEGEGNLEVSWTLRNFGISAEQVV